MIKRTFLPFFLIFFVSFVFFVVNKSSLAYAAQPDDTYSDSAGELSSAELQDSVVIDITEGQFSGWNSAFYFTLPEGWRDEYGRWMVEIRRVDYEEYMDVLDWFNINHVGYYGSKLVMQLFVYDKSRWPDNENLHQVVMKTQDYVFAVSRYGPEGNMTEVDQTQFDLISATVAANGGIKELITLGPGQTEQFDRAVIVNGQVLDLGVEIIGDVFYVPLRETCEAFGYTLDWDDGAKMITVRDKGTYLDALSAEQDNLNHALNLYETRTVNDRAYVPAAYFAGRLGKDIVVDDALNIIISN